LALRAKRAPARLPALRVPRTIGQSADARICISECTDCARRVETILHDVCPTRGGGFCLPADPTAHGLTQGKATGLASPPAGSTGYHTPFAPDDMTQHVDRI